MRELFRQHLDGDRALELGVAGFVHLAHAASPEGGDDLIRAEAGAGRKGQTVGSIAVRVAKARSLPVHGQV